YARWDTTAERRLGTVCLFHGRTEFIEKYFETITDLRRRGFAVATMDWRGQGGSSRLLRNPAKGHAETFAHHDGDVRQFMTQIVLPDCPPPFYCLAHSMGGHLVLRLAQTKVCWWERIVLSAPMIKFAGSDTRNSAIYAAAESATFFGLGDSFIPGWKSGAPEASPFESNRLTSDRLRFERAREVVQAAPRLGLGAPTIGWIAAASSSISVINSSAFMESIKVPILIVAAGNDQIVSTPAIERFASRIKNCTRIVVAGAKHEILQERDQLREQCWAAFDAYVPGSAIVPRTSEQPEIAR
ncbi:MAG: alpha/beta hydrolase, partial [Rhodomicrobium sp.]|nr:alpha/beta hydrolase [Rhodomicrobium sp.]